MYSFLKKSILLLVVGLGVWIWQYQNIDKYLEKGQIQEQITQALQSVKNNIGQPLHSSNVMNIAQVHARNLNKVPVMDEGKIIRILPDDNKGIRHQRFIVKTNSGTVLIVHNIDSAPRIQHLIIGDRIRFKGEFIQNNRGGLVHWTHCDSKKRCRGWLEYKGRRYQ